MPNIVLPKDLARAIVDNGTKLAGKTTQTVRRAPDFQEPVIVLFNITDEWHVNENGELYTTGHIVTAGGVAASGTLKIYAPTVQYESSQRADAGVERAEAGVPPSLPKGIVHAALLNGRYELLSGGGGGLEIEIHAGTAIAVTEPDYTIHNRGVWSYCVDGGDHKIGDMTFSAQDFYIASDNRIRTVDKSLNCVNVQTDVVDKNTLRLTFSLTRF